MAIRIVVDRNQLPTIRPLIRARAGMVVRQTAIRAVEHMKMAMRAPKHGRVYVRGGAIHRASAPGEAPAVDTGNLWNSIQIDFPDELRAEVGVGAPYAPFLEYGTSKMAPRPFFWPAVDAVRSEFEESMRQIVRIEP